MKTKKGMIVPKKKNDKIHLGAWKRGATARWKKEYRELNPKHTEPEYFWFCI